MLSHNSVINYIYILINLIVLAVIQLSRWISIFGIWQVTVFQSIPSNFEKNPKWYIRVSNTSAVARGRGRGFVGREAAVASAAPEWAGRLVHAPKSIYIYTYVCVNVTRYLFNTYNIIYMYMCVYLCVTTIMTITKIVINNDTLYIY